LVTGIMIEDGNRHIYRSTTISSFPSNDASIVERGFGSKNRFIRQKNKGKAPSIQS